MLTGNYPITQDRRPVRPHLILVSVDEADEGNRDLVPIAEQQDSANIVSASVSEPAEQTLFGRLKASLVRTWTERRRRKKFEAVVRGLLELSDHHLRDIGIERWQIRSRFLGPLSESATSVSRDRSASAPFRD